MTHVVTGRCVDCKYTDCCVVCPVQCFYTIDDPAMLVIDPATCIDCMQCVPVCPVHAIYADSELPPQYADWKGFNAELFPLGANISEKQAERPGALNLEQVQAKEKAAGWTIPEPSTA